MQIKDHRQILHSYGDLLSVFEISDEDTSGDVQYFGYLNSEGMWIIQKCDRSSSPVTYRYASGRSGYAASWTLRADLSYAIYNLIF
mgnify:CR=1 FL=1